MAHELVRPEDPYDAEPEPERPRRPIAKIVIAAIAVLLVIIIAVRLLHARSANAEAAAAARAKGKRPIPVAVATAESRNVPVILSGLGNVQAYNTVTVKVRIDGQLERFNFAEGQTVHAGEELALIDPRPSEAALAQMEANRFKDAAQLENARRDLERYTSLYHAGVLPQQQFNTQEAQVRTDEGLVKADDAQIQNAQLNVSYCHIKSPINGRVGLRFVDPGNMVHASDPNGLVVITQLQPVAVLFTLPEDQLQEVTQHMRLHPLLVEAWSRDNTEQIASGHLETIDNEIDPNTGTFRLKGVFDNRDGALYPNQFVNARLQVDVDRGATVVPATAIQHGTQGTYVYVVKNGTAEVRPVTTGITEGTDVVIAQGLAPGETVVTDGQDKLQNGSKVELGGGQGGEGGGRRGRGGAGGPGGGAAAGGAATRGRGAAGGAGGGGP